MEGLLVPFGFFVTVAYIFVGIVRAVSDGRTRRKLIETGASPELAAALVSAPARGEPDPTLRWGIVIGALGLGFIVLQLLPFPEDDPIMIGLLLVFLSAGLLLSYAITRRSHEPARRSPTSAHTATTM
ncbi:MAG TPA: DUF6249 domain-containing protein [Gemmatimonadaceae bacterium]|nr:DUF6249 domain-containing protein [Gemmatimonadaceae bacterium]